MKKTIIASLLIAAAGNIHAQWECPSRLGATLKPIENTNLMWSAEITSSAGFIKDNYAANTMGFLGLNYGTGKSSFYIEGGFKAWIRGTNKELSFSDDAGETVTHRSDRTNKFLPGLREAFYRYSGENNNLTLGLQSAKSDDSYLLNERIVGANYSYRANNLKFNVIGGSVMQEFARNGRFCTLGYLYNDIVVGRPRSYVGNGFGDTNMAMATLSFTPQKKTDEFGSETGSSLLSLDKIGGVAYTEFGGKITHPVYAGGLYSEISLAGVTLKPEILVQASKGNNAVIYDFTAEKLFNWENAQTTRLYGRYVGYSAIDNGARPVNSFSNLFMGDVLRQDVLDAPAVMFGVKHSFTAIKTSVKIQGVMQTKASALGGDYGFVNDAYSSPLTKMKELDFGVSKNFGKSLLVNAMCGMLDYPTLELTDLTLHYNHVQTMYGRLELRFTF
jgi:hypothetical protein